VIKTNKYKEAKMTIFMISGEDRDWDWQSWTKWESMLLVDRKLLVPFMEK